MSAISVPPLSEEEARALHQALKEYLKTGRLDISSDQVARVRSWSAGEPGPDSTGLTLPPWRLEKQTPEGVELRWTFALGHESGTRRWFTARVDRKGGAWIVRDVTEGHARRLEPGHWR